MSEPAAEETIRHLKGIKAWLFNIWFVLVVGLAFRAFG